LGEGRLIWHRAWFRHVFRAASLGGIMKSNPNRGYGKHATTGFLEKPETDTASKCIEYRWPTSETKHSVGSWHLNKAVDGSGPDFET